jgi:hypothetical protein
MAGRHPFPQIRRQQERRIVINKDKAGCHAYSYTIDCKSDRLLGRLMAWNSFFWSSFVTSCFCRF